MTKEGETMSPTEIRNEQNRLQKLSFHERKLLEARRQVEYHAQAIVELGEDDPRDPQPQAAAA